LHFLAQQFPDDFLEFAKRRVTCLFQFRDVRAAAQFRAEHQLVQRRIGARKAHVGQGGLAQLFIVRRMRVAVRHRLRQFVEPLDRQVRHQFRAVRIVVVSRRGTDADPFRHGPQRQLGQAHFIEHRARC
jgi:hypothetical protein